MFDRFPGCIRVYSESGLGCEGAQACMYASVSAPGSKTKARRLREGERLPGSAYEGLSMVADH
jgi:hypothetical protein